MFQYHYSSLSPRPDSIRLLRLMPYGKDERAKIKCKLSEYSLQDPEKGTHMYEALSYTWGGSDKPSSIFINKRTLAVTENLHAALLRLRDRSFERILWIDAICIHQENLKEQGQQVQLMAKIYSKATRVLVWLGEMADDSDIALERIRMAAENESPDSLNDKTVQQAILNLFKRPWFRRIWVLQEVVAARNILVLCGSTGIDGYAFYLGVDYFYESYRDLESSIRSIAYLIRGAVFRSKYIKSSSNRVSLDIAPLSELIDTFHTHNATKSVDKIYALLGMSSDNPSAAGLLPDYEVPSDKAFEDLVKFILCKQVWAKAEGDKERVVIKSKGYIIGQVLSVKSGYKHRMNIALKNMPEQLGYGREFYALWTLKASAKQIREGDIICLLQGAPNPVVIRQCGDYFSVIRIAVFLEGKITQGEPADWIEFAGRKEYARWNASVKRNEDKSIEWLELLQSITAFPRDLLLIWSWKNLPEKLEHLGPYEALVQTDNWVWEQSRTELGGYFDKASRLLDVAIILDDLKEHEKAVEKYQEAINCYGMAFGEALPHTPNNPHGQTPLSWAAWNGYNIALDLLLAKDGIDPDLKDPQSERTALSWARNEAAVKQLLERGAMIEAKDKGGWTPLSWAVGHGHQAVVKLLVEKGANLEVEDEDGRTPLFWARQEVVAKLLLERGAKLEVKDKNRRTPLSVAAEMGHEEVVKLLVEKGANLDVKDMNGWTPLLWAVGKGHRAVVELLEEKDPEIQVRDKLIRMLQS